LVENTDLIEVFLIPGSGRQNVFVISFRLVIIKMDLTLAISNEG